MANRRSARSIAIETKLLEYININYPDAEFTIVDLIDGIPEFSQYKYIKRTTWHILKMLTGIDIIGKTGNKKDNSECYKILEPHLSRNRLRHLKNEPILLKSMSTPKEQRPLPPSEVGKNIIEYVNSLESKLDAANKRIRELEFKLGDHDAVLISEPSRSDRVEAGGKMFVFKK